MIRSFLIAALFSLSLLFCQCGTSEKLTPASAQDAGYTLAKSLIASDPALKERICQADETAQRSTVWDDVLNFLGVANEYKREFIVGIAKAIDEACQ